MATWRTRGGIKTRSTTMTTRRQRARQLREAAAEQAFNRDHPVHVANGDERASWDYGFSFTKGLEHHKTTGLVKDPTDFNKLVVGIDSGDPRDFKDTPAGLPPSKNWRAWESEGAGLTFDLQGPDAQAVTMPPAPNADSAELTGEMAEVYAQAILRDCPLAELRHGGTLGIVDDVINEMNSIDWFNAAVDIDDPTGRRRTSFNRQTAFRGIATGDDIGPYLSQFMLVGTTGLGNANAITDGLVSYGGQSISQKVSQAKPNEDYMTKWKDWLDVQNGLDLRGTENYMGDSRFITTGRDLSTYVHYDALYQAYLTACLLMLAADRDELPFDPGVPFQAPDHEDHQQGFAHFGGPHILTLVTEVATRALKAVRYQKFNVHRRCRPEVMAARYHKSGNAIVGALPGVVDGHAAIDASGIGARINAMNDSANGMLLPMAFPEGSPMHPSYGAGHATVAGACVTILKAFFDHSQPLTLHGAAPDKAYIADDTGSLALVDVVDGDLNAAELTIEGELNKLAANISIGRDWAGVHYYSDYWESLKMGEQIAIGMLEEHKLCFNENFSMTIPLFDGGAVRV